MKKLIEQIKADYEVFAKDANAQVKSSNKAAGSRARKASLDIKKTMNLTSGQMSNGDMAKIRKIIIISLILSLYAILCSFVVDLNFQVVAFFSSFGTSTVIYTSGNKIVKSLKYYPGSVDGDADGIPDIIQHRYEKWVREQKKNGTEPQFITLEYYLDTNPEDRAILDNIHKNLETQGGMIVKT
jgi:hypothetical protein